MKQLSAGGDVLLFAASLALIDSLHATRPSAVRGAMIRRAVDLLKGQKQEVADVVGGDAPVEELALDEKSHSE